MANRRFIQFYQTLHQKPVQLDCGFRVDNSVGAGITGLIGPGIASVFMHTTTTPAAGSPNPAAGIIIVNFEDNYNKYIFGNYEIVSPVTGSAINISTGSSLTAGVPYRIVTLGTTTTANWVTVGVPTGIAAAVDLTFLAAATSGSGTGTVKAIGVSGISTVEKCGNPNLSLISTGGSIIGNSGPGNYLLLQCLAATNSSTTTLIPTAPAAGSFIRLKFVLNNSVLTNQGD